MKLAARDAAALRAGYSVARAHGMSEAGAELATAQGWRESFLGLRGPFLLPSGPSFNWGATTARSKGVPWFGGGDHDRDGNPITQRWAGPWPTMGHGFRYWASFGSVRRAWSAYNAGDEREVARILYLGGYYTGVKGTDAERIAGYASWLRSGRAEVQAARAGELGRLALAGGVVAAAVALWRQLPRASRPALPLL